MRGGASSRSRVVGLFIDSVAWIADNEIRDYLSAAKDFHKLTERVLMEDLYDRTPHILDHAITILLG